MSNTRELEKKAKRRLAAVAFLTNISLDGSYKDTEWCLGQKVRRSSATDDNTTCAAEFHHNNKENIDQNEDKDDPDGTGSIVVSPVGPVPRSTYFTSYEKTHSRTVSLERSGMLPFQPDSSSVFQESCYQSRHRANTSSSDITSHRSSVKRFHHPESDPLATQKHAHFSSNESFDPSMPLKSRYISNTNVSELSFNQKGVVKCVNPRREPFPKVNNERLVLVVGKRKSPVAIFSTIPYSREKYNRPIDRSDPLKRTRNVSGSRPVTTAVSDSPDPLELLVPETDEMISYGYLMAPSSSKGSSSSQVLDGSDSIDYQLGQKPTFITRCVSHDGTTKISGPPSTPSMLSGTVDTNEFIEAHRHPGRGVYSPQLLDDPEFRAGKHRTLLTFPSYRTSIIDYCKSSDMKRELNEKFKERFPNVQLTLSKLRSLKREMRKIAKAECNIDLLTVANAYVYFEKLILGSFVTKLNRKLCSGACLLLAAKMNDVKGETLHILLEKIETGFRVNKKDLLHFEFAVLVALEFALHVPTSEVYPHFQRLLYES